MRRLLWVPALLVPLLAACSGSFSLGGNDTADAPATPAAPATTVAPPTTTTAAGTDPAASASPTPESVDDCALDAALGGHLTIPEDTEIPAGAAFEKSWRLINTGCQDWPEGTEMIRLQGDPLGAAAAVDVRPIVAGGSTDVTVSMTAPDEAGEYRSSWQLRAPNGRQFGTIVGLTFTVPTPAAGDAAPPTIFAEPMPLPPEILFPGGLLLPSPSPSGPDDATTATPDADEVRRSVSLRVDLLAIDYNTFTGTKEEELIFIEPDIVLTTLRPTDVYTHELCANGETRVRVETTLTLVDEVVHAESVVSLYSGARCLTGDWQADDAYSVVAGDGQTVTTSGWNVKGGGGYEVVVHLTNEPWRG